MKGLQKWIQVLLVILIIVLVNVLGQYFYGQWDLTEEKRFTLTQPTKELLGSVDDIIYVKVLLEGQFPAGFKRLRKATQEMLDEFRSISPYIQYEFENPNDGTSEEVAEKAKALAVDGFRPVNLKTSDVSEKKSQVIWPYAVFNFGARRVVVDLLESDRPGESPEVTLNNGIGLLEYKMANAVQKLKLSAKPNILFTKGHGELEPQYTQSIEKELRKYYNTSRIDLSESVKLSDDIALIIVAQPRSKFSDQDLYLLDQYVVQGGSVMFLIDPLDVNLDSVSLNRNYVPAPFDLGLDRLLFKYGARIEPSLVLDLRCTRIPIVIGQQGGQPQTELFSWYYYPVLSPTSNHPIVKNIDLITTKFPGSLDTLKTSVPIRKEIILESSEYSRFQLTPARISFDAVNEEPKPENFNRPFQKIGVLLEGRFESAFKNRMTPEMLALTERVGAPFQEQGNSGKIIIVTDGDIIKNGVNNSTGEIAPVGYNRYERFLFNGNRNFLLNAVEYLAGEGGILTSRSKEVKLRMLDTVKAKAEKGKWQMINIIVPLLMLALFGVLFNYFRRKKFAR